ncbi:MAG: NADP(H)-dependent aldo-keto reductase [Bacteroidota bacterium]|uniref:NADP(H)-dependent aldo-keto reductase n=1 Tax=Flagellimonas profundi TaxID=2915620 RepID=A0ABS3FF98_9FLAO|nr:NADP(H)-dependent aldo-keto reductase [Allomuricauda profundi]MBO0341839.1 NADP(H)-dependent aldo-keto reductase [Allomuricauda profundi]MEC7770570.1 NADP(H)-dependent aldo-keto reductase [Bacteroidota bacterium]
MKYTRIPHTDIRISKICLGTMTWGRQNNEDEAHEQMDYALDQGVNFFDTAELYPVPAKKELYAVTEELIGNWFKKTGNRDKVVLASKIAGPGHAAKHIRSTGFSKESIINAVDGSLKRLQTDYIDLFQLHWPERNTNYFGQRGFNAHAVDVWDDNIHQVLETLRDLIAEGKIRHVGLSNETPWGTMRFLEESKVHQSLPRMRTIQNPYSLLNRLFEVGLSEISMREQIGLLAYSPLGFGVLSGKYLTEIPPRKARVTLFPNYNRYSGDTAVAATKKYAELAKEHGLSLAQMALAFVNTRPFLTSNIIGATSMEQLKENIESIDVDLSDEVLEGIEEIHKAIPNPAP